MTGTPTALPTTAAVAVAGPNQFIPNEVNYVVCVLLALWVFAVICADRRLLLKLDKIPKPEPTKRTNQTRLCCYISITNFPFVAWRSVVVSIVLGDGNKTTVVSGIFTAT